MFQILRTLSMTVLAIASFPAVAHASPQRASISASIPDVCRLDAPILTLSQGQQRATGFAFEACNSASSYNIAVTTRQLAFDEDVAMNYGMNNSVLNQNGTTNIATLNRPSVRRVPIILEAKALNSPLTLVFALSAI